MERHVQRHDLFIIMGLVVVTIIGEIIGPTSNVNKTAIINSHKAVIFEVSEISVICFFIAFSISRRQMSMSLVLIIALYAHIQQIITCTRMSSVGGRNVLTIIGYSALVYIGLLKKEFWFSILMTIGTIMHLLMLICQRPFISKVCWKDGRLVSEDNKQEDNIQHQDD